MARLGLGSLERRRGVAAGIFGPTPAAANGREFYNADAARLEMPDPRCATCCRACGPTLSWVPPDPLGADTSEWSIFVEPPGQDLQPAGAQASSFPPRKACSFLSAPGVGLQGLFLPLVLHSGLWILFPPLAWSREVIFYGSALA